jgi:hypothetical protein
VRLFGFRARLRENLRRSDDHFSLSRWAVTLLAAGYKFPAKFGRNFDGANAGSRSCGRRERAHPTAKLLRV